jgi:hypothetical protein
MHPPTFLGVSRGQPTAIKYWGLEWHSKYHPREWPCTPVAYYIVIIDCAMAQTRSGRAHDRAEVSCICKQVAEMVQPCRAALASVIQHEMADVRAHRARWRLF